MAFGRANEKTKEPEQKAPETTGNAVAKTGNAPPPAFLDKMKADAGKGVSTAAEDRIVPLIYILQANSPQVKPRDPKYVEGAQAGDIWMRNAAENEIVKGDAGFSFQPCGFFKVWLEWLPNRGGFVSQHADDGSLDAGTKRAVPPKALKATEDEITTDGGDRKKVWVTPEGNILVHTRQHVGLAYVDGVDGGRPYIVPMSSTGHTISRRWMDQMNQFMVPGTKDVAPSFARKWRFTTVDVTNAKNQSWSVYKIVDEGWVSPDEYDQGQALYEAFARGEKQAAAPDQEHDDAAAGGGASSEI